MLVVFARQQHVADQATVLKTWPVPLGRTALSESPFFPHSSQRPPPSNHLHPASPGQTWPPSSCYMAFAPLRRMWANDSVKAVFTRVWNSHLSRAGCAMWYYDAAAERERRNRSRKRQRDAERMVEKGNVRKAYGKPPSDHFAFLVNIKT